MAAIVLETSTATPVWAAYKSGEGMFDEMLDLANSERNGCQPTAKALFSMPPDWFAEISGRAQQMFRRMGVTFNVYGGADGVEPPRGTFITVAGIDLVRGADGRFYVLEDNARTPSGVSYVIENRHVMTRLMPDLMRSCRVRSVERYPADLLQCLIEQAPGAKSNPTIALLTPGPYNSAFFEHVFLSQQMGIELVEGQDLVCADHKLYMKTVHGLRQVDVLYRRIDDDFVDPLVFRSDSM